MEQEWKIGEIRQVNGKWYQCVEGACNNECYFHNRSLHKTIAGINGNGFGACNACFRNDNKSVIFKKLEKVGKPYTTFVDKTVQNYLLETAVSVPPKDVFTLINNEQRLIAIEIKQNKENMEDNKKQTSLNSTKNIYEKFKGKTMQCLVNNKDGDLVNGYGIVCGYNDKYLIIGFTNEYEGCIKSFANNVFLENRDFLSYRFWNISHVDDKPFIKLFNLEAAKAGKPVCTRDGRNVRIICFDAKRKDEKNIIALVPSKDYPGFEDLIAYPNNGNYHGGHENDGDLMMLPEKKEGWAVIRRSDIYETEKKAKEAMLNSRVGVMIRKINWEE